MLKRVTTCRGTNPLYYGYLLIPLAFLAQFVAAGSQNYIIGPFMIPMSEDLGWTRAEFTSSRSLAQVVMAVTGFFVGTWVDKNGARRYMVVGTFVLGVSYFAMGYVTTLTQWIITNGVTLTVGASMLGNLVVNVTLTKWFVVLRGRAVAIAAMGVSFAGIVMSPLATWLIDEFGWRYAWQFIGLLNVVVALPAALLMRRAPEDYGLVPDGHVKSNVEPSAFVEADFKNSLTRREAVRTSAFYMLVAAFGLHVMSMSVFMIQTVPYLSDHGYSRVVAGFMISLASIPSMLSKPVWGWLIDSLDPKPLASISVGLSALGQFLIVYAVTSDAINLLYLGYILMGIGIGGMIPLQETIWGSYFGRRYIGSVRSAAMPLSIFLTAGAPVLASYYYDVVGDYTGILLIMAAVNLLGAVMVLAIRKPAFDNKS